MVQKKAKTTMDGITRSTCGNITHTQAGVSCFVGQESAKFKVHFFV
jgi:hypothetical protein